MTKILVIEDEKILREEVVEWLNLEGYEARGAEDGMAGVETAFRYLPDLIVCDITMPRLDGYGVLLELRSNLATGAIPFIFTTARASAEDIRHGMTAGADDYITKPFTRLDLLQAIQTRLEKKAVHEQNRQHEIEHLQKALDKEQEYNVLKAKLVAMFSHDFRNPLMTILSSIVLVRNYADRMDAERRLTHLNRAEASVHQLIQMLDDMLFLAQTDAASLTPVPEPLYIGDFFEQVVDEFRAIYGETINLLFESNFTDRVSADPRLLRQIASNLISNAVKYSTPGGEVQVTLDRHDGAFILTVNDQGMGIPEADQLRLFSTFQRGSNVKGLPGTGLGLAIVKQAVDLHGGSVHLESQVGVGTTITVHIPIKSSD